MEQEKNKTEGEWIATPWVDNVKYERFSKCSHCGTVVRHRTRHCPFCGYRMSNGRNIRYGLEDL